MIDHLGLRHKPDQKIWPQFGLGANVSTELRMMKILRLNKLTGWRRNTPVLENQISYGK